MLRLKRIFPNFLPFIKCRGSTYHHYHLSLYTSYRWAQASLVNEIAWAVVLMRIFAYWGLRTYYYIGLLIYTYYYIGLVCFSFTVELEVNFNSFAHEFQRTPSYELGFQPTKPPRLFLLSFLVDPTAFHLEDSSLK